MQQVKLFKGIESDLRGLESEINAWLTESGAKVVQMLGNIAPQTIQPDASKSARAFPPSDVMMAILYEK